MKRPTNGCGAKCSELIVVCQVFYPDAQSTSQLLSDVTRALTRRGVSVGVLAAYPALEDAGRAPEEDGPERKNSDMAPRAELWHGVFVRRGGLRAHFKRNLWLRLLAYVSYSLFVVWQLLRMPRGQRVLVVTNPPFAPVVVSWACRWRRHSYSIMLQDIYPDGLTAVGRLRPGGAVERTWRYANRVAFNSAHEIWVIGRDMAALVRKIYGVPLGRIRFVPHWSPVEFFEPRRPESTRLWHRLQLSAKFVVQYSGNMGLWHDIENIISAAERLRHRADIHFLFIGAGIRRAAAEQRAHSVGLSNVTWLPPQSKLELTDSLACCHAALISQRPGLEGVAVPCKLYGILGSGRPVIAQVPENSEVAMVLEEERCGIVVQPGDPGALADAIVRLVGNAVEVEQMGRAAYAAYRRSYTLTAGADAFERGFREWVNGNNCDSDFSGATRS